MPHPSPRPSLRAALLGLLLLLALGAPASARRTPRAPKAARPPSARILQKAAELARRGEEAIKAERPGDALTLYQQAHDLNPQPPYLLRIAECHRLMGNAARSAFTYRQYLRRNEQIPNRAELEELAKRLEELAAATRQVGVEVSAAPAP